jgi:hypothetical protein
MNRPPDSNQKAGASANKPAKGPDWSAEKLAGLSDDHLRSLLENALRLRRDDIAERCETEIKKRPLFSRVKGRPARKKSADGEMSLQDTVAAKIASLGHALASEFDLSKETAKALSEGVKKFMAHATLSSSHEAKIGGLQREGKVAISRYTSYRVKDEAVSLSAFLKKDEKPDRIRFLVQGPARLMHGGKPISAYDDGILEEGKSGAAQHVLELHDFDEAAQTYRSLLAQLAPRRTP